jgi:glycine/D-amino acid oxidase-like deaminating enzyme
MKIAILGAGFCGLAAAWHLKKNDHIQITLFDPLGIGKCASGVAAGLLHKYAGSHAKRNWRADEGYQATCELLQVAESALGTQVARKSGMLRVAHSAEQEMDFKKCSQQNPDDVHWFTAHECTDAVPSLPPFPGIFINSAMIVDCERYLAGLWLACQRKGVQLEKRGIRSLAELSGYDLVVCAMGAATHSVVELQQISLKPIKGQVLVCRWPENMAPLPYPINSQAYLLMNPDNKTCIVGATFERDFTSSEPDLPTALNEILPKLHAFFPHLDGTSVISCRAGVRAATPDHKPLLKKVTDNCWVLSGMGSKGLLYHALCAKDLASQV